MEFPSREGRDGSELIDKKGIPGRIYTVDFSPVPGLTVF